jgi:hypothetical protein
MMTDQIVHQPAHIASVLVGFSAWKFRGQLS